MPPRPQFRLHDHLGNTVVFFEDKNLDGCITTEADTSGLALEILQRLWYYPFGMEMEGLSTWDTEPGQWYRYNGKERDTLSGWTDFGARWYDAGIGRWNGVDPLAGKYYGWSPFSSMLNNPISFIDSDGRYVVLGGPKQLQDNFANTLNTYLGIQGIFSVSESGYLSVNQLSENQFNSLNAEQQGFYTYVKLVADATTIDVGFQLVDEDTVDPVSGLSGKDVYIDGYDHGVFDVGDLSMVGSDVGQATVHALYEQALHDNPLKMLRRASPLQYEDAHEMAIAHDKAKIGYSFDNERKSDVDGNRVYNRDKVNQKGEKIGAAKITLKSSENLTIIKYENE